MSCVHPLLLKNPRTKLPIQVSCGQCMNCRIQRSMSLSFLSNLEIQKNYALGRSSSFVTLTYDDAHLPFFETPTGLEPGLCKKDLQNFFKRFREILRKFGYKDNSYKLVACGELGDKFNRPHYHFVAIGLNETLVDYASSRAWKFGLIDVGVLFAGGLNYVCKYMTKAPRGKLADELYTSRGLEKPFLNHSIGLGDSWLFKNLPELIDNNWQYYDDGILHPLPSYVRRKLDLATTFDFISLKKILEVSAHAHGYQTYNDYKKVKSYNAEKMAIDASRVAGVPVQSLELANSSKIYDINDYDVIVKPELRNLAKLALEQ